MKKKNKKQKKKLKKKEKLQASSAIGQESSVLDLQQKIKKLELELKRRERKIDAMKDQIKEVENKKSKKGNKQKGGKGATKLLLAQQSTRVGIAQRDAWRQHGFLRHRYEYHMESGEDKTSARSLADRDLREKFGDDAGYSEEELEHILS